VTRKRQNARATLLTLLLSAALPAQEAGPQSVATPAQVVRVAKGSSSGLSGAGDSMTIERGSISWEREPSSDWVEKGVPAEKRTCEITKQDWDGLINSIDPKTIAQFTGIEGCPACVDQPEMWAELDFSDGTKKAVDYGFSQNPPEIVTLLRRIEAIAAKCPSQLLVVGDAAEPVSTALYAAKPTKIVDPVYPESAKANGSQVSVIVYVVVGKSGAVETVTAADGPEKLRQAAIDAARQWRWEPHLLDGQAIRFRTKAVVYFSPHGAGAIETK
jgi:TonB family protein